MRVTVLLDDREHATLMRACGGRGVATLLREAGLREAAAMKVPGATLAGALLDGATPERLAWLADDAARFLHQNGNFPAPEPPVGAPAKVVKR